MEWESYLKSARERAVNDETSDWSVSASSIADVRIEFRIERRFTDAEVPETPVSESRQDGFRWRRYRYRLRSRRRASGVHTLRTRWSVERNTFHLYRY